MIRVRDSPRLPSYLRLLTGLMVTDPADPTALFSGREIDRVIA